MPQSHISKSLIILVDLCIVTASFFLGYLLRSSLNGLYPLSNYIGLLPLLVLIWGFALSYQFATYNSFRVESIPDILFMVFKAGVLAFLCFGGFTYLFKITFISRALILFIFLISAFFIGLAKIAWIVYIEYSRKRGLNLVNTLIIGTGKRAQNFVDLVNHHHEWGINILGLVDDEPEKVGKVISGHTVLGSLKDVPEMIHSTVVDEVVFIVPRSWIGKIEELMLFCENEGVKVNVAVDYFELKLSNTKQIDMDGFPMLTFKTTTDKLWHLLIKRIFDILASGAALVVLSPFFAFVAILIKLDSEGPVFFKQERCGLHGRKFFLYKFRTMVVDAEERLKQLMAQNEMSGPAFKMARDPRITALGRFFRKFSIDELPQFWNVLNGDMSIVGPRPPIPSEVNKYDNWHRRRLSMKPGVTCLWQVNGRNKITDFNEWVRLDLQYIDNWSLWLEFKILVKTIPTVLFGIGAK